jgi:hypothetical protein
MGLKHFILGFFAKTIASLDDTATKVPVVVALAKKRVGKVAFALGSFTALLLTLFVAGEVASFISGFSYTRYVLGAMIVILAVLIRFDVFTVREKKVSAWGRLRARAESLHMRFIRLTGIGFLVTLVTLIDDTFAYLPLLADAWSARWYAIGGIILSALIQLYLLVYFAETLQKFKYAKQVSFYGLLIFAALVFAGFV